MNTIVKIKSCTRASASGKNLYNLTRQKNKKRDILVLENNEMPVAKNLSKDEKKEIHAFQKIISKCEKRLAEAIEKNKPKSIATNEKNIKEAQEKLGRYQGRGDEREKHFVELTIALTNSYPEDVAGEWASKSLEFIKKKFPKLKVISAVEHRDQHSPHMHILLHSENEPITNVLAETMGQKDTSRESMKQAYGLIAHDFHSFADEEIAHNELESLNKGRKYVSLGQFKQKGNFEAKEALRAQKIKEKEEENERKRFERDDRGDGIRDVRTRISGHIGAIIELGGEHEELREKEQLGKTVSGITETASELDQRICDIRTKIERLFERERVNFKHDLDDVVAQARARNAKKRELNRENTPTPKPRP